MEVGGPGVVHRRQIMYGYDRVVANPLLVMAQVLDRLFPTEDVDRVLSLQLTDLSEILLQDFVPRRIPACIDDENAKAGG